MLKRKTGADVLGNPELQAPSETVTIHGPSCSVSLSSVTSAPSKACRHANCIHQMWTIESTHT